ncbi:hypothetical protein LSPH26S_03816 [Lysinibacillus sphaericus]
MKYSMSEWIWRCMTPGLRRRLPANQTPIEPSKRRVYVRSRSPVDASEGDTPLSGLQLRPRSASPGAPAATGGAGPPSGAPAAPTWWLPSDAWACCRSTPSTWWRAARTWYCIRVWAITRWLDEALADGKLAETWAHEACLVCAADLPWHRAWRAQRENHWGARTPPARMHREQRRGMDDLARRHPRQRPGARRGLCPRAGCGDLGLVGVEAGKALAGGMVRAGRTDGAAARALPARVRVERTGAARPAARPDRGHSGRRVAPPFHPRQRACAGRGPGRLDRRLPPAEASRRRRRAGAAAGHWRAVAGDGAGLDGARLRASRPRRLAGAGAGWAAARHAYGVAVAVRSRWYGIVRGCVRCSISTTAWSATRRPRDGATAISCCRSCIAANWSGGSTPRHIGVTACSR